MDTTTFKYLPKSLRNLTPNANWVCGVTYNSIIWHSTDITKPTFDEIVNEEARIIQNLPMDKLREERNNLLEITDMYGLVDFQFSSDEKKQEWFTYRQSLRDITSTVSPQLDSNGILTNVTFPTKPSGH